VRAGVSIFGIFVRSRLKAEGRAASFKPAVLFAALPGSLEGQSA
jgi:hypothetical protein